MREVEFDTAARSPCAIIAAMNTTLRVGTLLVGLGLIGIGLGALVFPGASSLGYGVPSTDTTWVAATGLRDLTLGLLLVALRIRHPQAVRLSLSILLILPIGDAALVLVAGKSLASTLPHVLGAAFCAGLLWWTRTPGDRTNA